jgi:hypothetical protein
MKKLIALAALALMSCSTPQTTPTARAPSAADPDLSTPRNSRLGQTNYKVFRKGLNRSAVRLYMVKAPEEPGSYYAVLFQYANLPGIFPKYAAARNFPAINKAFGYLKKIGAKISAFKAVPGEKPRTYRFHPLQVSGATITASAGSTLTLNLSEQLRADDPLGGATLTAGEDVLYNFPAEGDATLGAQYNLTKFTYEKAGLDSTWWQDLITGRFLAAYGKVDDEVLFLKSDAAAGDVATFVDNTGKFPKLSRKKRVAIFTHPGSAFVAGDYKIHEPVKGMFVLTAAKENQPSADVVTGKIGLFLDIFDASKALGQCVVELAFVDPSDPEGFLMYYEHPDNRKGDKTCVKQD